MDKLILNIEKRPALEVIFSELGKSDSINTELFASKYIFEGKWMKFLYKIHHSKKINRIVKLPGKKLWDRFCPLLNMKFESEHEYYVAFLEIAALQYSIEELERLKKYKNVHLCLILFNPMELLMQGDSPLAKMINAIEFEKYFAIFDERDVMRPGFNRLTAIYSKMNNELLESEIEESDFFYIGMAKDRQRLIQEMYFRIVNSGKKADFTIVCPDPDVEKIQGIKYVDEFLDYEIYLKHVYKTKCIVEILQGNQHGMTLRTFEAIVYGKHLLTNNDVINSVPYYNSQYMHFIENFADFDIHSIVLADTEYEYKGEFSPINLLGQIKNTI